MTTTESEWEITEFFFSEKMGPQKFMMYYQDMTHIKEKTSLTDYDLRLQKSPIFYLIKLLLILSRQETSAVFYKT